MAKKKHKKKQERQRMQAAITGAPQAGQGVLAGLSRLLPSRRTDQFLLGALIGAAATYVLADEALRGKLIKSGLNLYANLAGGLAEMKEQMADIQAEMGVEQKGAP